MHYAVKSKLQSMKIYYPCLIPVLLYSLVRERIIQSEGRQQSMKKAGTDFIIYQNISDIRYGIFNSWNFVAPWTRLKC